MTLLNELEKIKSGLSAWKEVNVFIKQGGLQHWGGDVEQGQWTDQPRRPRALVWGRDGSDCMRFGPLTNWKKPEYIDQQIAPADLLPEQQEFEIPQEENFIDESFDVLSTQDKVQRFQQTLKALQPPTHALKPTLTYRENNSQELLSLDGRHVCTRSSRRAEMETRVGILQEGRLRYSVQNFSTRNYFEWNWKDMQDQLQSHWNLLEGNMIRTGSYRLAVRGEVMARILKFLAPAFYGPRLLSGRSFLGQSFQKKIVHPAFQIWQNPYHKGAWSQGSWDQVGYRPERVALLEDGRLKQCLHTFQSAHKMQQKPTGNSVWSAQQERVSLRPKNLYFENGNRARSEILRDLDQGVWIESLCSDLPSVPSSELGFFFRGWWVQQGRYQFPIQGALWVEDVFEWMSRNPVVGRELEWCGSFGAPDVLLDRTAIMGR